MAKSHETTFTLKVLTSNPLDADQKEEIVDAVPDFVAAILGRGVKDIQLTEVVETGNEQQG